MSASVESWRAEGVTPDQAQAYFADVTSFGTEIRHTSRAARRAGWIVGAIGATLGVVGLASAAAMLPLKRVEVRFIEVERTTGYVGPAVGVEDAPKLFTEATANHFLRQYVMARESYVPETDRQAYEDVTAMSSPDEQARYAAWRRSAGSPVVDLQRIGHVSLDNFRISQIGHSGQTFVYLVRFTRTVWRGVQPEMPMPWSATIQFQWHPELPMSPADRLRNPAGMLVLAYDRQPDDGRGNR